MRAVAMFLRRCVSPVAVGLVLLWPGSVRAGQADATRQAPAADEPSGFVMDGRPSFRFGNALRLDLTSKIDFEWRDVRGNDDGGFDMGRRRIGIDGRLFGKLVFEVERELSDDEQPWRDAFVEWRQHRALRVRAGRFKLPFGAEQLTSIADLDFVQRTAATGALTPGRDTGVQVSGRLFGRGASYAGGVFRHDGDLSGQVEAPAGRTVAARAAASPFAWTASKALRQIDTGVAFTHGDVPEGLNGSRARSANGLEAFAPMYVAGSRLRLAADASFVHGPFAVRGEVLRVRDQRLAQGLGGDDLPDLVARGWHVSGSWIAIGSLKSGGAVPRPALFDGGIGVIQFAARVEHLAFRTPAAADDPFRNPRAANVLPNDLDAWTVGVNWYPVRYLKLQVNLIRERLSDPERRPDAGRPWSTTPVVRFQFAL